MTRGLIDVRASRELQATILAIRSLDKTVRKAIRQYTKALGQPEWQRELAERADSRMQHRMLVDTAVLTPSDNGVRLQSASKGRPLTGGLNPKSDAYVAEFGTVPKSTTYTRKSRSGGTHQVRRRVTNGLPARSAKGHVFHPAAREFAGRSMSLWIQTVVRTILTAAEGKQE